MSDKRERLIGRRKAVGLTQEALAADCGVEPSTVGRWERGLSAPQPWLRSRLARALKVPMGELDALLSDSSAGPVELSERIRDSQQEWLRVRRASGAHGRQLAEQAAWLYPADRRAPGGHVLSRPGWLLNQPVELDEVRLEFRAGEQPTPPTGPTEHVLPLTDRGERYTNYARAVRDLVRPRLLENRLSYRLLDVATDHGLTLTFGTTTFFEVFHSKETLAHEVKAAWAAGDGSAPNWSQLPLRAAVGDPFDPARLLMSPGVNTLTIRRDARAGHRFLLHQRDGRAVADGGNLCSVLPAGEFQPSSIAAVDVHNDFSLWRNIMREYSEELLGQPEHDGSTARSIDYATEEPFRSLEAARREGTFRLWHYGLVLDALTLGASQRTVAVIEGRTFDRLFAELVSTNDEGRIVGHGGRRDLPFTAEAIDRLEPRLSASALTSLRLAWRDRQLLLD